MSNPALKMSTSCLEISTEIDLATLRQLEPAQLEQLCQELRSELISTIREVGGHFASNLGVVELTVALHAAFDTPADKLIWDTGHQGYIHKMLTGRRSRLSTIRSAGGLSGFLSRSESDHDHFGAGHAGTSISAAVGFAHASQLSHNTNWTVAIIGDGALTSGLALEALNHAGELAPKRLIVIVNRNGQSISENTGALHHNPTLQPLARSFGLRYRLIEDGHSLEQLLSSFREEQQKTGPVLIEILTVKGKGLEQAEKNPLTWHALKPGRKVPYPTPVATPTLSDHFGNTLLEIMHDDPRTIAISAAMIDGTGLRPVANTFPQRVIDVGIAEQHAVTYAAGLACSGLRPIVAIYDSFMQRAFDQIAHDICLQNLPVIFALDRAGLVGDDGPTHQGLLDFAAFRALPNLALLAPSCAEELTTHLKSALNHNGPTLIRYPKGPAESHPEIPYSDSPFGKATILHQGSEALILAAGPAAWAAKRVAEKLEQLYGVSITVVDLRSIKPLDRELLKTLIPEHPLVITLEEHQRINGVGSAILEEINDSRIPLASPLLRLGISDHYIPHASQDAQRAQFGLTESSLMKTLERRIPRMYQKQHYLW